MASSTSADSGIEVVVDDDGGGTSLDVSDKDAVVEDVVLVTSLEDEEDAVLSTSLEDEEDVVILTLPEDEEDDDDE